MEENKNGIIKCKNNNEQNLHKSPLVKSENKNIKSEKNDLEARDVEAKLSKIKDEINNRNTNKVLKRKKTEDGVVIERVLSEGEASSGFETVSSIDSKVDIEDLEFSSSIDNDDDNYNIIVKVKNELAFQNKTKIVSGLDERFPYHENKSKSSNWQNHKTDSISNEYTSRRHNNLESSRESKYWQRKNVDKNYNYGRRDRESSERKNFERSRQRTCNKDQSTFREQDRRSGRNRWDSSESRSRRSRSKDRNSRFRGSRSPPRSFRNRSPNYKESRHLRSFERNSAKSSPERSSPPRKKRRDSPAEVSFASIWKKLNDRVSLNRVKKEDTYNGKKSYRKYFDTPPRKKERTPFLVELERKLKEVDRSKNHKQEPNVSEDSTRASRNESTLTPGPPPVVDQSCNSSLPLMCITPMSFFQGAMYPVPYPSIPPFSINNLPLVPGPTGLPVHIMPNGEQIPHDMDGRPIPTGPNGYYLPVDPTGRLFPHIISPENQAVPIHMTEDGVLRLPNSEPVPFGPEHQFPVNIDGRFIPIGPDSKPLYPCPDIPKNPPINFLQRMNPHENGQVAKTIPELPPPSLLPPGTEVQEIVQTKVTETQTKNQNNIEPPVIDLSLLNLIQNPSEEVNKVELLNKYKKKAQKKSKDILKCKEIEKNLGVNPSKGGVKRSIPKKLCQKKNSKDDSSSGSDMVLDSGDSDTTPTLKIVMEPSNKDSIEEIILNSDDEKNNLEIICDEKVPKKSNLETGFEDYITEKVRQALKLLNEKKYEPPIAGRFIISDSSPIFSGYNSPNESPLLRNRIQLSFLTPNIDQNYHPKETELRFKFLPQKNYFPKVKKQQESANQKSSNSTTIPVFTFDFAVQCDFTSEIIRNLNSNVSKLEMEITRLKLINANLFDDFRNAQNARQKNSEELKKALLEIQDKNNEILSLKRSIETHK